MSDDETDLDALFESARAELTRRVDPASAESLRARLERAVGGPGDPTGGAPPAGSAPPTGAAVGALARQALIAVIGFGAGFAAHAWTAKPTIRVETRERVVEVPVERVIERVIERPVLLPQAPSAPPPTAPTRQGTDDLVAEQWMIDQASAALREGRHAAALAAVEEHRRRFFRGQLRVIREVLRAEALSAAGRRDEALAVARDALRSVGAGPLRARLQALLESSDGH